MQNQYDIIVVGAGHAGIEASLASARLGMKTVIFTVNRNNIAEMSCNPAIGGISKGNLVREIDAMGGEMAKAIDSTGMQFRLLNSAKGIAVQSPRAQADKKKYRLYFQDILAQQDNITIQEDIVEEIIVNGREVIGIRTMSNTTYYAKAVIICTGTFLNGLIHIGEKSFPAGRLEETNSVGLSNSLVKHGLKAGRLKTGTSARIDVRSVSLDKLIKQEGDYPIPYFSFFHDNTTKKEQVCCYITHTNEITHGIIRKNIERSPLFNKTIKGIGPRYCPSIEDKVFRFQDKNAHPVFLEPESRDDYQFYVNGLSTSLPEDIQIAVYRSIEGMEKVEFIRPGYAIEYDYFLPTQLRHSLETKELKNLFLAGQINGTSGYEEAAAQGLMAGINAVFKIKGEKPFILGREEAYIGVMIDDLTTKGTTEPYRMFTSRAEYRLLLCADTADKRLMHYGRDIGLISAETVRRCREKYEEIDRIIGQLKKEKIKGISMYQYLKKPDVKYTDIVGMKQGIFGENEYEIGRIVEYIVKYVGYIEREKEEVIRLKAFEKKEIPENMDYEKIKGLSKEARQKLSELRPDSVGNAMGISGIKPADISILIVYLRSIGIE